MSIFSDMVNSSPEFRKMSQLVIEVYDRIERIEARQYDLLEELKELNRRLSARNKI